VKIAVKDDVVVLNGSPVCSCTRVQSGTFMNNEIRDLSPPPWEYVTHILVATKKVSEMNSRQK